LDEFATQKNSRGDKKIDNQMIAISTKNADTNLGGYLSGGIDFMQVSKVNTKSIDFTCRHIISGDNYKSLGKYVIDFARLIAHSANSKFVEVAFFDSEIIDSFCFINPGLQKKIEPLSRFDRMLCFRSDAMFGVREMPILKSLHTALAEFYKKNSINYRHNSFFVPMQFDWMQKGTKLIGSVIIMDPNRSSDDILATTGKEQNDVKTSKMIVSAKSTKAINSFANSFVCELRARYSDKEFKSLIELSKLYFTKIISFLQSQSLKS
jgi:hypothetical protein